VCGAKFFDTEAMAWLATLLGPTADLDENAHLSLLRREREGLSFDSDSDRGRAQ
jgi:hypothetical protein